MGSQLVPSLAPACAVRADVLSLRGMCFSQRLRLFHRGKTIFTPVAVHPVRKKISKVARLHPRQLYK